MTQTISKLVLSDATIERDGKLLLGPVNLSLESSGITCLLGHNGAGKSLFLKLCHGQFSPSSGSVLWGKETAQGTRRDRSFMFQGSPLLRRSVAANVEYPLVAHGMAKSDRMARVAKASWRRANGW